MEPSVVSANIFRFGLFQADAAGGTLMRNGVRIKLQDQPFRVLLILLERPGEIVTREELRQKLWTEGTFVDFDGSLNVILKKLRAAINDDSDNPRFIETVPRRGYRFIAPVSNDRKPEAVIKVNEASQDAVSITREILPSETDVLPLPRARNVGTRSLFIYAASAVAVVIVTSTAWMLWRSKTLAAFGSGRSAQHVATVQVRKSIAVLGFHSLSGDGQDAWLATALSEMLSTELSGGEKLRLVSGEDVVNLRLAAPWSQTDTLDQATTARIGNALDSDLLVLGSYTTIGKPESSQIRIDIRLQDAGTGEILAEVAEIGSSQDLFRLVSRVGTKLRDRLGVAPLQDADEVGILASLPLNPDAARFYALGITKLRRFDALAAKDLLLQATESDPKFSLGHLMLARAWSQLGYEQMHRDEAKKALDLAGDLPRADRMLVEGEYYESVGKQEQAASVYHALYEIFPDDVEYGLRFASAAMLTGNASRALEMLHRLRNLPAPASADPRIDLAESRAIKVNTLASLSLIREAVRKALVAQGKTPIYALARREECMRLLYSDQPEQAEPVCEDAYNIFLSTGNRAGAADSVRLIADHQGSQGHYQLAISTYERALSLLNGLGEHAKTGAVLNNMAIGYANEGKLDRALELYQDAKTHFEKSGDKPNASTALTNIADIMYLQGNLPGAEKVYKQSLDLISSLDGGDPGYVLSRIADLELTEGRVKDAKLHAQQAVDSMRPSQGAYQYLTGAMIEFGEALEAEGDLAGARSQFEQTLSIREKMGQSDLAAESQVELAALSMEEGHPDRAESLLRTALAEFEKESGDPDSASAYVQLSRALLLQGKAAEAGAALDRAMQFSSAMSSPALKLPAIIQKERIAASSSPVSTASSAAQRDLKSAIATAKKLGYYNLEIEGRLALGQLQLKTNPTSGRALLTALVSETQTRGLALMARHAQEALGSSSNVVAVNRASPR
jgi:DNA-binding winged helix-turn-helix (wHTH) protein/tetratricopeptide (TPR) repeat protein